MMLKLLKPFLMICLALLFLAGCAASQNLGGQTMEPYIMPGTVVPTAPSQTPVISVTPALPQTAVTISTPSVEISPEPETVWPVTPEAPFDPVVYPLSAPDELLFRNVFGNAAATIYAEVADFYRTYAQRKAGLEGMDIEEAGMIDTEMDGHVTIYASIMNLFSPKGGTHACMESGDIIFSECTMMQCGLTLLLGFASSEYSFSKGDIQVYYDGYPMEVTLDEYPLEQGASEQYAIYSVTRTRSSASLPEESLVEIRFDEANFVFRTGWNSWEPTFPQTEAEAEAWLLEAQALREAVPAGYSCHSLGDISQTVDDLTFTITNFTINANELRICGDVMAGAGLDSAKVFRGLISRIGLLIGGHWYGEDREMRLGVHALMEMGFDLMPNKTCSTCWEMTLPFHASEILNEEIVLTFTIPTQDENLVWQEAKDGRNFKFTFKIDE